MHYNSASPAPSCVGASNLGSQLLWSEPCQFLYLFVLKRLVPGRLVAPRLLVWILLTSPGMMREQSEDVAAGEPGVSSRITEHLTTAVVTLDARLKMVSLNPAAEVLLSISQRQAGGLEFAELIGPHSTVLVGLARCISDGHPYTEREADLSLHGGGKLKVDVSVSVLPESAAPMRLLVEMRQVDWRLRIAREENLLAQYSAARALAKGFAHEVKNPLGGLRGAAQLLDQQLRDPELKQYTAIVIREADRLRKLVDTMLGPHVPPQPRSVNLHQVLEEVRLLVMAEIGDGRVEIVRDYDPSIPALTADHDQLIQALLNIVRNAVQAVNDAGTVSIRTRIQRQCMIGNRRSRLAAQIEVTDNGPGISPEMIGHIFMPMVSSKPRGTGLGLCIAQNLINQHHGLIECASRPGDTRFTVTLPVESVDV